MNGCLIDWQIVFQLKIMAYFSFSKMNFLDMAFIAQNLPSAKLLTRQTLLKPPIARHLRILYFSRVPSFLCLRHLKSTVRSNIPLPNVILQSRSISPSTDSNPIILAVSVRAEALFCEASQQYSSLWKRYSRYLVSTQRGSFTASLRVLQRRFKTTVSRQDGSLGGFGYNSLNPGAEGLSSIDFLEGQWFLRMKAAALVLFSFSGEFSLSRFFIISNTQYFHYLDSSFLRFQVILPNILSLLANPIWLQTPLPKPINHIIMINSFKSRIAKAIQTLQSRRQQILEALKDKSYGQLCESLSMYCEAKSLKMLISVLESDFELKDQTIGGLFDKMDKVQEELTRQEKEGLEAVSKSIEIPPNNSHLPSYPQTVQVKGSKQQTKSKVLRRLLLKQRRLNTDSNSRNDSLISASHQRVHSGEGGYYSEKKMPIYGNIEGWENHPEQIFKIYHKLPLGILKEHSFEERSLSYRTMNYEKILAFLTELGLSLSADGRLLIIKIMRKHSTNHKFINKGQWKDIYEQAARCFYISGQDVRSLIEMKLDEKKATFQPNYDLSGVKRYTERISQNITKRQNNKNRSKKLAMHPIERNKTEKTYTMNALEKLRTKQLTWEILFNMPDASKIITNSNELVSSLDMNRSNVDEDSYYLQEFYNRKQEKASKQVLQSVKISPTKGRLVLPTIKPIIKDSYSKLSPI